MRLHYLRNGHKKAASFDNAECKFSIKIEDGRITVGVTAGEDIALEYAEESIPFNVNFGDRYFLNGYQSWTDSAEFRLAKRLRNIKKSPHIITKLYAMDKYGDSAFYRYSIRKSHGYDIFYSRGKQECILYNVNYETAYLIIELIKDSRNLHLISDLRGLTLKKGESVNILDYRLYYNYKQGMEAFVKDFPKLGKEKLFGYTSWYNYYQNISEEIILRDLEALDSRFNIFQIDDGYETFVGDWLDVDPKKFPNGLEGLVKKIHEKGFKAGLWLAPFVAETNSKLFKEHPEYFAKDKAGHPILAGGNWSRFYALDLNNKEAMDYVRRCLTHYKDMGFDFFKLDFLYAVAVPSYPGETRCMSQRRAYRFLREVLGDKLILGCGANIINSVGVFDYLRIGPDVSLKFDDVAYMRLFHRERISTKVTIQNTIYRFFFNDRFFANDPDVFLLRDENLELSKEQRKALTLINAIFGSMLMTSDNIAVYDPEKKEVLERALDLFQNAKNAYHETKGHHIHIHFTLNGEAKELIYDAKKGVLTNE